MITGSAVRRLVFLCAARVAAIASTVRSRIVLVFSMQCLPLRTPIIRDRPQAGESAPSPACRSQGPKVDDVRVLGFTQHEGLAVLIPTEQDSGTVALLIARRVQLTPVVQHQDGG